MTDDWSPGTLLWTFTETCNLDCHYCYVRDRTDDVSTERRHRIAETVAEYDFDSVTFTGGDPLTAWDDLRELLPYFADREILLDTNGAFLDDAVADELATYSDVHVQMTLNGPSAAVHDASRGSGAFDAVVEATEHLQRHDIPYTFGTTLLPSNREHIEAICATAAELGAETLGFNGYMPVVSMTDTYEPLLDPPQYRDAIVEMRRCHDEFDDLDIYAGTTLPFAFLLDSPRREAFEIGGEHLSVCGMGDTVYLTPRGDVVPCLYIRDRMGNVLESDLREIMASGTACEYRSVAQCGDRTGPCASCTYSDACGGCPAISMAVYGQPDAGDPRCWMGGDDGTVDPVGGG
jgi:radical SAM protein with 4Fe4S-binding SPASM domain